MMTIRLLVGVLLAGCAASAYADVTISQPWIRGMVAGQSNTAFYASIESTEATRLAGLSSPVAKKIEIHEMVMDGGVMKMHPVESLELPANKVVELKPGGYHAMLIDVSKPLAKGEKVPVRLTFRNKDGKERSTDVQAEVQDLSASPSDMHMKMN